MKANKVYHFSNLFW